MVGDVLDDVTGFHHLAPVISHHPVGTLLCAFPTPLLRQEGSSARSAGAWAVCEFGFAADAVHLSKVIAIFVQVDRLPADIAKHLIDAPAARFRDPYMHGPYPYMVDQCTMRFDCAMHG